MDKSNQSATQNESSVYTDNKLILTPNISDGDDFYDELLLAHSGMKKEASDNFNARLILILCNHIGNRQVITQALEAAKAVEPRIEE